MKILLFFGLLFCLLLTSSCQKVIEIKLAGNEPVPVIEGYIEEDSLCFVQLSSTIDIFNGELPPFIEDAVITISDDQGNSETLLYNSFGAYRGSVLRGTVGRTYSLSVTMDGKEYKASSTIMPVVSIDSITVTDHSNFFPGSPFNSKTVKLHYTDPSTTKNSYLLQFVYSPNPNNNEAFFIDRKYLLNDDNKNGQADSIDLFSQSIETGDVIVAELRSIDQTVFDYYFSIEDALTSNSFTSAAPANPTTNLSNGALGYFGAWSKDVQFLIIP
ncbi:MAG: DUF4249 domain-containing protein [Aureispira sp.]